MSKLLRTSQFTSIHRRFFSAVRLPESIPLAPSLSPLPHRFSLCTPLSHPHPLLSLYPRGNLSVRGFNSSAEKEPRSSVTKTDEDYPSGEHEFKEFGAWKKFGVKLRTLIAFPWDCIPNGSVLTLKLRGQISDELKSPFAPGLSLPQICENFLKAAYDPRISGIYLHIEPLKCGWGKREEIRRLMLDFKKSGKFIVGYAPAFGERLLSCMCLRRAVRPSKFLF